MDSTFSEDLLQGIVASLAGVEEHDFSLHQKINAARLKRIQDSQTVAPSEKGEA